MLKLVQKRTAWWPFTLYVRGEDGQTAAADIKLKFALPDSLEAIGIELPDQADLGALDDAAALRSSIAANVNARVDRLAATVLDWQGVADEGGRTALSYDPALMRRLLLWPEVPAQVMAALAACLKVNAPEKNSDAPEPGGQTAAPTATAA